MAKRKKFLKTKIANRIEPKKEIWYVWPLLEIKVVKLLSGKYENIRLGSSRKLIKTGIDPIPIISRNEAIKIPINKNT